MVDRRWMLGCGCGALLGCADPKPEEAGPVGADSGQPAAPASICHGPPSSDPAGAFADRTDAWGLVGVTGSRLSTADLDQDGWPDLIVSEGVAFGRDDFAAGTRYHHLLMNRPSPDGAGRTFEDATVESGFFAARGEDPALVGRAGMVHVFGDVDNDGDLDAFSGQFYDGSNAASDPGDRSELLLNRGDGTFELAPVSDLQVEGGFATTGASFVDYDADGLLDLWVVGWYESYGLIYAEQDRVYRGNGDGTFVDQTTEAGLEMDRGYYTSDWIEGRARRPAFGATSCDLDGDAWPDLLATNYGRSWNQQWMNNGDSTFIDISPLSGFAGDNERGYSDNQFYRCWCEVYGCDPDPGPALLAGCEDYADYWIPGWDDLPHRLNGNSFSTACGDVDNDGDQDLISSEIVHWHIGQSSDPTELLLNDGEGRFTRPGREETGLLRDWGRDDWNEGDLFVALFDYDNDGWRDILLVSTDYPGDRMFLYHQDAPLVFSEVAEAAGIAHPWPAGAAVADFDRDGDLDVVTGSSNSRSGSPWSTHEVHLYENQLPTTNSIRIRLQGAEANHRGVGARVELRTADGQIQVAEVGGGYGHMGMHHDLDLHFGLGEACAVEELTVTWPGGAVDSWTGLQANYLVLLQQGGDVSYPDSVAQSGGAL